MKGKTIVLRRRKRTNSRCDPCKKVEGEKIKKMMKNSEQRKIEYLL